jgi:hypothetical protein
MLTVPLLLTTYLEEDANLNIRKFAVVGALSLSLTVGSASAFAASLEDTIGLSGEESINKLVALQIFMKTGSEFGPEAPLTRGELAYMLTQSLELDAPKNVPAILDVKTKGGANARVAKAVANGYISLNGGKFHATNRVTYATLSRALAVGLGFKLSWSNRPIDHLYFLERKGVLSIDTDLDAVVTREAAAVAFDKFLAAAGAFDTDSGVISEVTDTAVVINNGSEYAEYKLSENAALFINGQSEELSTFGAGTKVHIALNDNMEIAYMSGGILGLAEGTISYTDGQVKVNDTLRNIDLNAIVDSLPNAMEQNFTFTTFGMYSSAGVTFGGGAFVNEGADEVTKLSLFMKTIEGKSFSVKGNSITVDFSGDALDNQTFVLADDVKITLETDADNLLTPAELQKLQINNTLSGKIEADSTGAVTAITAKVEPIAASTSK